MRFYLFIASMAFVLLVQQARAQRIVYSEPDREDSRRMNFEVIGKISGNFLIYKGLRDKNYISIYDNNMNETGKIDQDYLPTDRLINVDFFPYADFAYLIYEYQKKNIVYCNAVKIDGSGHKISDIKTLDTSHIGFAGNNKIYSAISSEDKSKVMIFKINSRNKSRYLITTYLFNDQLELQNRSAAELPMHDRDDYLSEFDLDNEGDLIFAKFTRNSNDAIINTTLVMKTAEADTFSLKDITHDKIYLDELHIKVDNVNKRYFLTSFYYKQRRGNIEGFYFYVYDKATGGPSMENTVTFSDELRKEARGDANVRMAFNDYFIKNIIIKRDGGFLICSEAYYTTSRFNNWNRWDYLYGSPYFNSFDYYSYSPYLGSWGWRNRYYNNQAVRYHADNITILSFDNTGKLQLSNVIHKEQFDDESDDRISYLLVNTGSQLHFLFNQEERRALLLNDYTLVPGGRISHNPTLKNLDRGYEFLPKYGKQVSNKQVIIPCFYRNYICFAKIDFT